MKFYTPELILHLIPCTYGVTAGKPKFITHTVRNKLGFKSFESASRALIGIEIVRMIKKEQVTSLGSTYFKTFCSMAA